MNVLKPLVRTVLLAKILLEATSAPVNLAIQTGTVRQVTCLVKLIITVCDRDEVYFSHQTIFCYSKIDATKSPPLSLCKLRLNANDILDETVKLVSFVRLRNFIRNGSFHFAFIECLIISLP